MKWCIQNFFSLAHLWYISHKRNTFDHDRSWCDLKEGCLSACQAKHPPPPVRSWPHTIICSSSHTSPDPFNSHSTLLAPAAAVKDKTGACPCILDKYMHTLYSFDCNEMHGSFEDTAAVIRWWVRPGQATTTVSSIRYMDRARTQHYCSIHSVFST